MKTLLIDGDSLVWAAVENNQYETWWDSTNNLRTAVCNTDQAAADVALEIDRIATMTKVDDVTVVIGPDTKANFRVLLWPEYKAHRRRADAPVGMKAVRDKIRSDWGGKIITALPHEEADDVLANRMTHPRATSEHILWSPDKDMLQVPGMHWSEEKGFFNISVLEADLVHMTQTLTGDTSDGYPGCKGVGKVGAAKILDPTNRAKWWPAVVAAYKKAEFTEQFALNQARVARILRYGEEPGQWTP